MKNASGEAWGLGLQRKGVGLPPETQTDI